MPYIPLHNHSSYSLLEGAMPVKALLDRAAHLKLEAVGLMDTGNLFGAMEFCLEAQKVGIKPIIGALLPINIEVAGASQTTTPFFLPLLVKNETGYHHLCRFLTQLTVASAEQKTSVKGALSLAALEGQTAGLVCLTGGNRTGLYALLEKGREQCAEAHLQALCDLFPDHLYIELQRYPDPLPFERKLVTWAMEKNVPLIATNEAFFFEKMDHPAHDALLCIKEGTYVSEAKRRRQSVHQRFKTPAEMVALFSDIPEALQNTELLAQRCSFMLRAQKPILPPFPVEKGKTQAEELRQRAQAGLQKRLQSALAHVATDQKAIQEKSYQERLDFELQVILQMGFAGYFLIVADFIGWTKEKGYAVGPGRGSGAGSVVAWSLMITGLDPLKHGLLFERFLNPERVSMPDFDIDFCPEKRDKVIAYVQSRYGVDSVAHIITFGKLQARAVIRDVGRVLGMPYGQVDKIAKRIPFNPAHPVTLPEALEGDEELRAMGKEEAAVAQLFDYAKRLEGLYRHASTHAAGVVISDGPLTDLLPLYQDPKSHLPATQFSMHYVEKIGLVKFDFLGLKTLTVLQEAARLVNGWQPTLMLNLESLPMDDEATFRLLCQGHVMGLFQLESGGMRDVLRQLQPDVFEEIVALGALYRPGPMDNIPYYLACKHGREKVVYPYDCLEEILKETFGIMVYQEQVLKIAQKLAGYSLGQADILRKAMGKKIKSEMDAQRQKFVEGTLKKTGGTTEKASALFDQIAKFAGYAFNKAHATAYGLITYQTAYMKANHPLAFMTASMNQELSNTDRLSLFVSDLEQLSIKLLLPDINASDVHFSVQRLDPHSEESVRTAEHYGIRYGLAALKNVGEGAMEALVRERDSNGPFTCIHDVVERLGRLRVLNKRQMEHLIWAGAFDSLHSNRQQLVSSLEQLLAYGASQSDNLTLLDSRSARPPLFQVADYKRSERLTHSYAAIGFYCGDHPFTPYQRLFAEDLLTPTSRVPQTVERIGRAYIAGILLSVKVKVGKSGRKYAFLQISDTTGNIEVMIFEDLLLEKRPLLVEGALLCLTVTGRMVGDSLRLSVSGLEPFEDFMSQSAAITLQIRSDEALGTLDKTLTGLEKADEQDRCLPLVLYLTLKRDPEASVLVSTGTVWPLKRAFFESLWEAGFDCRLAKNTEKLYSSFKPTMND